MEPHKSAVTETESTQPATEVKTVRGSGFTYSEATEPTDLSLPVDHVAVEEIVPLPDLGEPNRP